MIKKKFAIGASAVLLIVAVIAGIVCTACAAPGYGVEEVSDEAPKSVSADAPETEEASAPVIINDFTMASTEEPTLLQIQMIGAPKMLFGAGNTVSVSKTVKATVLPATAKNTSVTWTVEWEDPAHTGTVTDYVTVTPASAGSTTATVTCYKPFTGNVLVTVTTVESGFTADCLVSFVGYPSEIVMTTALTPSGTNKYNIGINNPYTFNLSVDNVFGQVGDEFKNLNVTVTAHGQVSIGNHEVYRSGGDNWANVHTADLSTIQNGLITYTYENGVLTVKALKSIESYYSAKNRMDGGRTTSYENQVKELIGDCYFTVKVTEPVTGIAKEFSLYFDGTIVSGVNVDTSTLKF